MDVSEAVATRRSTRAYLDTPVSDETIRELLVKASRAPSGGNVQPWRIFVINGGTMKRFRGFITTRTDPEALDYDIYPSKLWEPYRSSRYKLGEDMYALLGIPREDKPRRLAWFAENLKFFGAPAGMFCFVDRRMGSPQWSDLGMFLQPGLDESPLVQAGVPLECLQHLFGHPGLIEAAPALDDDLGEVLAALAPDLPHHPAVPARFPQGDADGALEDGHGRRADGVGVSLHRAPYRQDLSVGDANVHADFHAVDMVFLDAVEANGVVVRKLRPDKLTSIERYHSRVPFRGRVPA